MKARDILTRRLDRYVQAPLVTRERGRSPPAFFVLVFALSVPFWLIGAVAGIELLPGMPVSALVFVYSATAATGIGE